MVELTTQHPSAGTRMPYARSVTRLATWPKFARVGKLFLVPVYQQRSVAEKCCFCPSEKHEYALFTIPDTKEVTDKPDPLYVGVNINGNKVPMEIDTGSASQLRQNRSSKKFHQNPYKSP